MRDNQQGDKINENKNSFLSQSFFFHFVYHSPEKMPADQNKLTRIHKKYNYFYASIITHIITCVCEYIYYYSGLLTL